MSNNRDDGRETQPLLSFPRQKDSTLTKLKRALTPRRVVALFLTIIFLIGTVVFAIVYAHNRDVVARDPYKAVLSILDRHPIIVRAYQLRLTLIDQVPVDRIHT